MIDIHNINPRWDSVIVCLSKLEEIQNIIFQDQSSSTDIAVRYGKIVSHGPKSEEIESCPGITNGDEVLFTEFAGYYIPATDTDNLYKVIRGYDIIGKQMKEDQVIPTGDRVLIEVMDFTDPENGIIYNAKDPKLADLFYGKVVRINPLINRLNLSEGQLVAFPPYAGTTIRHYESADKKELKILVEYDILFTV